MKRLIKTLSIILLCVMAGGLVMRLVKVNHTPDSPSSVVEKNEYKITYRAIENGTETSIYEPLYLSRGCYPTSYSAGTTLTISDLNGRAKLVDVSDLYGFSGYITTGGFCDPADPDIEYVYYGWYLDSDCTEAFDGHITAEMTGDITLYAKILKSRYTSYY